MYQYVSTIAKLLHGNQTWETPDISTIPFNILFSQYSRVIVILNNPFISGNVALDLNTIKPNVDGLPITILDYLVQNGNMTLPTMATVPSLNPVYAKYADAFHAGYKVIPMGPGTAIDAQLPVTDKTWLALNRPKTDYALFHSSCLVNVNGFYHLIDSDINGVYVVDGMKSCLKSKQNQIGIYSFRELGNLTYVPIKQNMLYKQTPNQVYKNEVHLNLGVDITNKTVMLVLGGYLHVLDDKTFTAVGTNSIRVDTANLPLLERYFESLPYLDFSSLNLSTTTKNIDQISVPEFLSDAAISAYFTMSQSFVVLLDNPNISVNKQYLEKRPLPNMFVAYQEPKYPVIVGCGKVANYWYVPEDGQYSITCFDSVYKNRLFNTVDPTTVPSVTNALLPEVPYKDSNAFFLEISSVVI